MVMAVVLFLSLIISVFDLRFHRIPNSLNLVLLSALLFDIHHIPWSKSAFVFAAVLLISILCKVGAGDIKLLGILILTQGGYVASTEYLRGFIITTVFTVLATAIHRRSLQGSIAFAPVILAPFLWLYLEI